MLHPTLGGFERILWIVYISLMCACTDECKVEAFWPAKSKQSVLNLSLERNFHQAIIKFLCPRLDLIGTRFQESEHVVVSTLYLAVLVIIPLPPRALPLLGITIPPILPHGLLLFCDIAFLLLNKLRTEHIYARFRTRRGEHAVDFSRRRCIHQHGFEASH